LRALAELELRRRKGTDAFSRFQTRYQDNPLAFVHDCIDFGDGPGPTPYQDEVLAELPIRRRVAVRGPHSCGKTADASWIVLWAALTADDCKVATTASAWRQLTKFLWPEIHKWASRLRWDKIGRAPFSNRYELLTQSLKRGPTCEAFAVASDRADLIEGAHAARLVYVFDEAKIIPAKTWDAAEGALSSGECYAFAISTPGEPVGRFYDIHSRKSGYEDWWVRHVTKDEAIAAGRLSPEWCEQRKRQWGEQSTVYQNRVLGEFAASEEEGVIPLAWVELANDRWRDWADAGKQVEPPMTALGVDVARYGADKTVIAPRYGDIITSMKVFNQKSTMETAGQVRAALDSYGGSAIIDVIGVGAGVVDRLRELGYDRDRVLAFNAGEKTDRKQKSGGFGFVNKRSASWWMMRELLDPEGGEAVALPPDDELTGELTTPHWTSTSGGRIKVESKDDLRKRLENQRSTDKADAVIMAMVGPVLCEEHTGSVATIELPW